MAARRVVWALARFLHRDQLPGEKEKNALAGCQPRPVVPKVHIPKVSFMVSGLKACAADTAGRALP